MVLVVPHAQREELLVANGLQHFGRAAQVHAALREHGPYIAVLVELPHAGNVRMLGNLLGDPLQDVRVGAPVLLSNLSSSVILSYSDCASEGAAPRRFGKAPARN